VLRLTFAELHNGLLQRSDLSRGPLEFWWCFTGILRFRAGDSWRGGEISRPLVMVEETLELVFEGVKWSLDVSEFGSNGGQGDWYLLDWRRRSSVGYGRLLHCCELGFEFCDRILQDPILGVESFKFSFH
jgi:hypothetical protein